MNARFQLEDTIEELYSCLPNNRHKFNIIMENMKRSFLRNIKSQNQTKFRNNQYKLAYKINNPYQHQYFIPNNSSSNNYNKFNNKTKNINNLNYKQKTINGIKMNNNIDIAPSKKYGRNMNYKPIKMNEGYVNHYNTQRNFYKAYEKKSRNNKKNGFKITLPEALLVNPKPLITNSQQKLLSDTHANVSHYCPEKKNDIYEGDNDKDGNGWQNKANNIMLNTNENFYIGNK